MPSALFFKLYFYISLRIFIATSAYEGVLLLYYNRVVARIKSRKLSRVREVFKYLNKDDNSLI